MTRLQTLKAAKEANVKVLDRYDNIVSYLRTRNRRAKQQVVESIFTPLFDEDVVEITNDTIYVSFGGHKNNADLRINLYERWTDEGEEYKTEYEINTSSNYMSADTTKDNQWIYTRFEKLAVYTQQAIDFMEDIIAGLNTVNEKYNASFLALIEKRNPYRAKMRKADNLIKEVEEKEAKEALMGDGIEFNKPEDYNGYSGPNIDLKFNWNVRGIRKIKVLKMSASGKSADVEIHNDYYGAKDWNGNDVKPLVVERVRFSNIETLLYQFQGWRKNA